MIAHASTNFVKPFSAVLYNDVIQYPVCEMILFKCAEILVTES